MAAEKKPKKQIKPKKERASKYEEKLAITGSFLDVIKASVKNADKNADKNDKKKNPR